MSSARSPVFSLSPAVGSGLKKATILIALVIGVLCLVQSAERVGLTKILTPMLSEDGDIQGEAAGAFLSPVIEERVLIEQTTAADTSALFAYTVKETVTEYRLDPATLVTMPVEVERHVLVKPFGYLFFVIGQMVLTIEIAAWATGLAVLLAFIPAVLTAENFAPHPWVRQSGKAVVAFLRSVPELILALFFLLFFGFGPLAGLLALTVHGLGFLAKFYAEEIENCDAAPTQALWAAGLPNILVLRLGVLPQILPGIAALTLYLFDRNVRTATIVGLVGGGGIGQELKGRYDLFQFGHVATIVLVIFVTVMAVDQIAALVKARVANDGTEKPRR